MIVSSFLSDITNMGTACGIQKTAMSDEEKMQGTKRALRGHRMGTQCCSSRRSNLLPAFEVL
jgi:hypothetical protein